MNPIYDFSTGDHAVMVGDQVRLELYRRAIQNQVKSGMSVVEIGTGTGILAAYAAAQTQAPVYAIEYAEYSAQMAEAMFRGAKFDHVQVKRGKSSDIQLSPPPQILITETIGALGPEENIVEICYDFKKRHPSITKLVPAALRIYAEPISSRRIQEQEEKFYEAFASASFGTFDYQTIRSTLSKIWTGQIRFDSLYDSETTGPRVQLVNYDLGTTESSAFQTTLHLEKGDGVHLYFEAQLDSEVMLSTHYSEPETHWGNAYVAKPKDANCLTISFTSPSDTLLVKWENK